MIKIRTLSVPTPDLAVADPSLVRPDWTAGDLRDTGKLWLDKNENPDTQLAEVVARVAAAMPSHVGYSYPDHGPLYRKLAAWLGLQPDNIVMGSGFDGLIQAVFEAYVRPGDTVLHTPPTFAMYFIYSKMYGTNEVQVAYERSEQGPALTAEKLIEAVFQHTPRLGVSGKPR